MRHIVLLRGVNLGRANRVAMPALRDLLGERGFEDVRTYVQSGNIVLSSELSPQQLGSEINKAIAEAFGLDVAVVTRTHDELAEVVACNPLGEIAVDPKRYQATFLSKALDPRVAEELAALAAGSERLVAVGRELYAWHPDGVGRSKLAARLGGPGLGAPATSRNWTTVTTLLEMSDA